MGNNIFRYFLEWLKHEMYEEAYERLKKVVDKRDKRYRGLVQKEPDAFVQPNAAKSLSTNEPNFQFNIKDQIYTKVNSFMNSIDELWHVFFPVLDTSVYVNSESIVDDYNKWQQLNNEEKHSILWDLARAEGDEKWLGWIDDHVWTYIGLAAPLLGAINPIRAVIRCVEKLIAFFFLYK